MSEETEIRVGEEIEETDESRVKDIGQIEEKNGMEMCERERLRGHLSLSEGSSLI